MPYALIPVKELSQAKARLAPALDDAGRRELALALFRDVLVAALACPALDRVAVVTQDPDVLSLAAAAGAQGLLEPGGPSASSGQALNEALTSASQALARAYGPPAGRPGPGRRRLDRLVILAADLPLAGAEEIEAVARAEADVVVVPSTDGGTNALVLPGERPGSIPFRFGPESARRHLAAAEEAGLRSLRLDLPALALDIDTPGDLARLRSAVEAGQEVGAHTLAALERLGLVTPPVPRG